MDDDATGSLLCTFRLGDHLLGVDVRDVQEVLHGVDVTPIPHAPASVAGLINLRGQIATTIDLRTRLGIDASSRRSDPTHVVVRSAGEPVSLLVDSIGEVLEVGHELHEPPPVTIDDAVSHLIVGTYKLTDELLLVLDVARVVATQVPLTEDAA
ncbi:chemotaxis protein CheW [Ilumatobacter sp.]|uniref:chemotaxis protein CheW n=1 Tax=Ilumatobacter sp. TaxID=1967498 RepID=UPI003B51B1E3